MNKLSIILLFAVAVVGIVSCSSDGKQADYASLEYILADQDENPWDAKLDSAPDRDCVKLKSRYVGQLRKAFNDSNYLHLEAASAFETQVINTLEDVWAMKQPLVEISSCREYYVDKLHHSYPYLVPEAADLLKEIGSRFRDSLDVRGGGEYRIKVTSVMRTPKTVGKLRRVNVNASGASAHQYATTFDISYSRFICDSITVNRSFEDLKNLLAEILDDLRSEGRCYVKYERKQACFHITPRP